MFKIIALLFIGLALGLIYKRKQPKTLPHLIKYTIWALLFLLGLEVGANNTLFLSLSQYGIKAIIIAIFTTIGSILAAWLLWTILKRNNKTV